MNGTVYSEASTRRGLGAVIWSQLFLRIAGSAGVLVIGGYFVEPHDKGLLITPVLIGVVAGLAYLTELLLAPPAGALCDGRRRKSFLLAGPLLAAFTVLLPPLGFLICAGAGLLANFLGVSPHSGVLRWASVSDDCLGGRGDAVVGRAFVGAAQAVVMVTKRGQEGCCREG